MQNDCGDCPFSTEIGSCNGTDSITQKHIDIVQEWSDFHPVKTRQSEFLKMFPDATTQDGTLTINPCNLDWKTHGLCCSNNCDDCRKKYWLEEIE